MLSLRIIGSSHVGALKHGLEALPLYGELDIKIAGFLDGKNQQQPFHVVTDDAIDLKVQNSRKAAFGNAIGETIRPDGAIYGLCMFPNSESFYCAPRWLNDYPALLHIIEHLEHPLKLLEDMRTLGIPCFGIGTPHPRRDNGRIKMSHRKARQIDRQLRSECAAAFKTLGLDYLAPPKECHDEEGWLKPEFCKANDDDHANGAYGALYMGKIVDYVKERYARSSL